MEIEEKIEWALADLEDLILEGHPISEALARAAKSYALKAAVLEARAAPSGKIEDYVERVLHAAARSQTERTIQKAAQNFVDTWGGSIRDMDAFRNSVRTALKRELTKDDMSLAIKALEAAIEAHQQKVLDEMLHAGTGRNPSLQQGED